MRYRYINPCYFYSPRQQHQNSITILEAIGNVVLRLIARHGPQTGLLRSTENARPDKNGPRKTRGLTLQDLAITDQMTGVKKAGRHNDGPNDRGGKSLGSRGIP